MGVDCVDPPRDELADERIAAATLVAVYLPMHTATRLAAPLLDRVRRINPAVRLAAYGLYAPLNREWLRARGVEHVLGPEAEEELLGLFAAGAAQAESHVAEPSSGRAGLHPPRIHYIAPDRAGLPLLSSYARLHMPDGSRRVVGSTDAPRGCKHLCRHCPIVPVYRGTFRAIPLDLVVADVRAQVNAGAEHISFGDPDFFNGPTHARRLLE